MLEIILLKLSSLSSHFGQYVLGAVLGNIGYLANKLTDRNFQIRPLNMFIHAIMAVAIMLIVENLPIDKETASSLSYVAALFASNIARWVGAQSTDAKIKEILDSATNKISQK